MDRYGGRQVVPRGGGERKAYGLPARGLGERRRDRYALYVL